MHMAWLGIVGGRLESRFQYSGTMVYNTFPWPNFDKKYHQPIEKCAQSILDVRAEYSQSTLADLYDPLSMPIKLLKAHQALDKAVDSAYGYKGAETDSARVAFLFDLYQKVTSLLPPDSNKKKKKEKN